MFLNITDNFKVILAVKTHFVNQIDLFTIIHTHIETKMD